MSRSGSRPSSVGSAGEHVAMNITILGGGPSGLYFAILMKQADPSRQISLYERDAPGDTFGWGIVFSDQTFGYLENNDGPSYRDIVARCRNWDDVVIVHRGEEVRIGGNSFSGIARVEFLDVLQRRCAELDIDLHFRTIIDKVSDLPAADLIVGADGANSLVRRTLPRPVRAAGVGRRQQVHLARHETAVQRPHAHLPPGSGRPLHRARRTPSARRPAPSSSSARKRRGATPAWPTRTRQRHAGISSGSLPTISRVRRCCRTTSSAG